MTGRRRAGSPPRWQAGISLVEMLVGVTIGLFVVAAASALVVSQITDNRRLLIETQLQQDLRATADIITRELRRSGYWLQAQSGVPPPGGGNVVQNPYRRFDLDTDDPGEVLYSYRRGGGAESFAFRYVSTEGAIRWCQRGGVDSDCTDSGQELTDSSTLLVTAFDPTATRPAGQANNPQPIVLPCPNLCADGTASCWPRLSVREAYIAIEGQSRGDSTVRRKIRTGVRLRNDDVALSPTLPAGQSCPPN